MTCCTEVSISFCFTTQIWDHGGRSLQQLETGLCVWQNQGIGLRPLLSQSVSSIDHFTLLVYHICSGTAQAVILTVFYNLLCVFFSEAHTEKKRTLILFLPEQPPARRKHSSWLINSQICCSSLKYLKCFMILFCNIYYLLFGIFIFLSIFSYFPVCVFK